MVYISVIIYTRWRNKVTERVEEPSGRGASARQKYTHLTHTNSLTNNSIGVCLDQDQACSILNYCQQLLAFLKKCILTTVENVL